MRIYHATINGYDEPVVYTPAEYLGADQETIEMFEQNYAGEFTLIVQKVEGQADRQIYPPVE